MRIFKITLGLAAGVLVLAMVAFAAQPSLAQAFSGASLSGAQAAATPQPSDKPGPGPRGHGPHSFIDATVTVTGLTLEEVRTQRESGQSLAQIAESKGKTAEEVIAAARTLESDHLKQAVTDGHLTQAQADAKLQEFDASATQIVNDTTVGQGPQPGFGHGPDGHGPDGHGFGRGGGSFMDATASVTGLTLEEVRTERESGKSLAQIAESNGKTAEDVIAAARTLEADHLKQAVTDDHLTQAQADAELQEFDASATQIVNDTTVGQGPQPGFGHGPDGHGPDGHGFGRGGGSFIDATVTVTGLTPQEVMTELQSGKSLAQIAESKGKTADDIIAAARTQLADHLKQAVTDGHLTQAQADAKLQEFDASAAQIVNDTTLGQHLGGPHFNAPAPKTVPTNTSDSSA